MKTIHVAAGRPYDIRIGGGLLRELPAFLTGICGERRPRLALITDDHVNALADGARRPVPDLQAALEAAGYPVCKFVFPNGEVSKTLDTVREVYGFLSANSITPPPTARMRSVRVMLFAERKP